MKITKKLALAAAVIAASHTWGDFVLTDGGLSVTIRTDSGAIDAAVFGGVDYFNPGTPVSNFGFQNGTDTGTFVLNTTEGVAGQTVFEVGNSFIGAYTGGGANVSFLREYSLIAGTNTLQVRTVLGNASVAPVTISYFDTFDPDQGTGVGASTPTNNDVISTSFGDIALATITGGGGTRSVVLGSSDPRATVAAGNPFQIDTGTVLNSFFSFPFDGNGASANRGIHIGLRDTLASGESTEFTYLLTFGTDPSSTTSSFLIAVPEPTTASLLRIVAALAFFGLRRRSLSRS